MRSPDAEARLKSAQQAVADLACTYAGFVPTITFHADGTIVVVEQNVNAIEHLSDPNVLPTTVHILKGEK